MKVHTGRGDDGTTGLLHGGRVRKDAAAVDAYGTIDEAVAALGLARAEARGSLAGLLLRLQRELFVVGAELATAPERRDRLVPGETQVSAEMCDDLAALLDGYEARLPELTEFVVPGTNRLSAALDHARTVIRRAERACAGLTHDGELGNPHLLRYVNCLGDLVFLLAREAAPDSETRS